MRIHLKGFIMKNVILASVLALSFSAFANDAHKATKETKTTTTTATSTTDKAMAKDAAACKGLTGQALTDCTKKEEAKKAAH